MPLQGGLSLVSGLALELMDYQGEKKKKKRFLKVSVFLTESRNENSTYRNNSNNGKYHGR